MHMKHLLRLNLVLAVLLTAACVTINVYFPAGAAEKAADQIIDSVIKGSGAALQSLPATRPADAAAPGAAPASAPAAPPSTSAAAIETLQLLAVRMLDLLVPVANAQQQANLDVSSSEIRAITASMQARFGQLERFFDTGVIGLTANGLIEIRDIGVAPLPDRARVKRLVADDNSDRDALYAAIARENEHPEWEDDIRRIFAQRWVARGAKPGWYFLDAEGNWKHR
jgi:uncharacterized protein YdbL (DUF1318 family)